MIQQIIYTNYAACLIVLFMLIFLLTNNSFEKKIARLFAWATLLVVVLMVADSIEEWTASFSYPTVLRVWMSAIGYTVRPLCILCILEIIVRDSRKKIALLELLAIINCLISFSALFSDFAFSYDARNEFVRGPLGWSAYIVCGIYLLVLLMFSIFYFKEKNYYESLIVLAIAVAAVVSVFFEVFFETGGLINTTIALSLTFYYMFFHTQTFKRDHLTQVLNRRSFYMDAQKEREHITAVISVDLNDLKQINDGRGHSMGDEALCIMAEIIKRHLPKECVLYRVGGDEFAILCIKKKRQELEEIMKRIKADMDKTQYSCAMGLAMADTVSSFDELCAEADKAMYKDKLQMKGSRQ